MFENETMEVILQRLLDLIPKDDSTAPDSPLYIMGAAVSQEWENFYKKQSDAVEQCFWGTANMDYLQRHAEPYGITPYEATPSQVEGKFNIELEIGTRFSKGEVNFIVVNYLRSENGYYYYTLECEKPGEIGNVAPGRILAIDFVNGLTTAEVTRVLVLGEEKENVDDFRERFIANFNNKRFCGNVADYLTELMEQAGVGKAKIVRCMDNQGETNPQWVTVVITDSNFGKPTEELIERIQEYFQPLDPETQLPTDETSGTGLSPIGQLCFVRGVKEKKVDVSLNISFEENYTWENTKDKIEEAIKEYFKRKVEEDWGDTVTTQKAYKPQDYFVTITRFDIYSILSDIDGVMNSDALKFNDEYNDLSLEWDEIPVLGELTKHNEVESSVYSISGNCPYNCPDCTTGHNMEACERWQHI